MVVPRQVSVIFVGVLFERHYIMFQLAPKHCLLLFAQTIHTPTRNIIGRRMYTNQWPGCTTYSPHAMSSLRTWTRSNHLQSKKLYWKQCQEVVSKNLSAPSDWIPFVADEPARDAYSTVEVTYTVDASWTILSMYTCPIPHKAYLIYVPKQGLSSFVVTPICLPDMV